MCYAISLPPAVLLLIERLEKEGFSAHAVGGCVRDSLLGRPVHDWDMTTSATPEEMKGVFADFRTIDTGVRHGTLTVVCEGMPYEITTYRTDGAYTDSRHPDSVTFTRSLSEDLARRDFTVNAMAYSPRDGIVDPFGGREDLSLRTLRAVGDPACRFTEDALRILRALRFSSVLDFSVEEGTAAAVLALYPRLSAVSAERICQESAKLLTGAHAASVLAAYAPVFYAVWPYIGRESLGSESLAAFDRLPADLSLRLSALCQAEDPDTLASALLQARFSKHFAVSVSATVRALGAYPCDRATLRALCSALGTEPCRDAAILMGVRDPMGADTVLSALSEDEKNGMPLHPSDLALSGEDLARLGVPRGAQMGAAFRALLLAVWQDRVPNDPASLAAFLTNT